MYNIETRPNGAGMSKCRRHRNRKYDVVVLKLYYDRILPGPRINLYIYICISILYIGEMGASAPGGDF